MKHLILILFLLVGCEAAITTIEAPSVSVMTDQELYHSGNVIKVSANVISPVELENVTVHFFGIKSGSYRLDNEKVVDIKPGNNTITMEYTAPSCNRCSGIKEGQYEICAYLLHEGKKLGNATVNVEIRQ